MSQSVLDIILRSKKEGTGVKDSKSEIDDLGKTTSKFGDIAKGVAVGGVGALVAGLTYAVNQAMETERVMRATEQVIKSTGGAAGMTADAVSGLAGELSAMSGVDDEMIQGAENVLLTFTSIGQDVFPQATAAALDMSVALGTDLQGAVTMIGKALQDPVKGVSALAKVGVNFNDTTKDTIKQMVEMNDIAGAQAIILKELNTEYGGMAEALGNTTEGKINKARNAIDNLAAAIGEKLLPVIGDAAEAANTLITGVDRIGNAFSASATKIRQDALSGKMAIDDYHNAIKGMVESMWFLPPAAQAAVREMYQLDAAMITATQGAYGYTGSLDESNRAATRAADATRTVATATVEASSIMGPAQLGLLALSEANYQVGDAAKTYEQFLKDQVKAQEESLKMAQLNREEAVNSIASYNSLAESLAKVTDAEAKRVLATQAISTLEAAAKDGRISQEDMAKAVNTVMLQYDIATPKSIAMAEAQQRVTDAFLSGEVPIDTFIASSEKIPKIASDGAISMADLRTLGIDPVTEAARTQADVVAKVKDAWDKVPKEVTTTYKIKVEGEVPAGGPVIPGRAGGGPVTESVPVTINELNRERFVPYAGGSMVPETTNNTVSIVINGAGQNAQAIAQAVSIELARKTRARASSGFVDM